MSYLQVLQEKRLLQYKKVLKLEEVAGLDHLQQLVSAGAVNAKDPRGKRDYKKKQGEISVEGKRTNS